MRALVLRVPSSVPRGSDAELVAEIEAPRRDEQEFRDLHRWTPANRLEAIADWLPHARSVVPVHTEALATGCRPPQPRRYRLRASGVSEYREPSRARNQSGRGRGLGPSASTQNRRPLSAGCPVRRRGTL
jgi:hypothetical protein